MIESGHTVRNPDFVKRPNYPRVLNEALLILGTELARNFRQYQDIIGSNILKKLQSEIGLP